MLIQKLKSKEAHIGIIGLGYVGLPLALELGRVGYSVTGFDIDPAKVEALSQGKSYINHIPAESIKKLWDGNQLTATTDFSLCGEMDAILIAVPTPLNKNREPEMRYVAETARTIAPHLKKDQIVILESTTYPGTTREVLGPLLQKGSGLKPNEDFYLAFSPEREDPNNPDFSTRTIPKVIGADHPKALEAANTLYMSFVERTVPVSNTMTAEATKLMENIFRSVNIALVNELKVIFDRMGIDVWEVIQAASTKPFGFMPFYPGPGLGGHCIPIDPFYLTWKAREYGISTRFIELAGEINVGMPDYVLQKIIMGLNARGQSLKSSKVLIMGVAYKRDVDDTRESPSLRVMDLLAEHGAEVSYHDPYVPSIGTLRDYPHLKGRNSVDLNDLASYDVVVVMTDHSDFDIPKLVEQSRLIVDTRNACGDIHSDKIIKA